MCSKEEESSKKISEGQSNAPTVAEQVEIKICLGRIEFAAPKQVRTE